MGIEAPARVKYALIREAAERDGNMLNVSWMCRIAGVTRSGYYAWLDAAPARQSRKEADQTDFANILEGRKKAAHDVLPGTNPFRPFVPLLNAAQSFWDGKIVSYHEGVNFSTPQN